MSKRRSTTDKGDGSKRARNDVEFRWEWEMSKNKWKAYPSKTNKLVNDALAAKKAEVSVAVDNQEVKIMFDKMVGKNKRTGYERRIRCCCKDADGSWYNWQWEDEKSQWNGYSAEVAAQLEAAYQASQSNVTLTICGRSYVIDTATMEQKNTSTDVVRKVARKSSDAEETEDAVVDENGAKDEAASTSVTDNSSQKPQAAEKRSSLRGSRKNAAQSGDSNNDNNNDDNDDAEAAATSRKASKPPPKTKSSGTRTLLLKGGKAPVDPECTSKVNVAHVYSEGKDVYDIMLNQTNLQNNNNKFYLMQLLEDDNRRVFSVWFRWGRVGFRGQNSLVACGPDLEEAKQVFCQKFQDKTKNEFSERSKFKKVAGKYDIVQIDYNVAKDEPASASKADKSNGAKKSTPDSLLDKQIQKLVELICNVKALEDAVMEMKFDTKKAPLGKLSADQIKAGNIALKKIETCLGNNDYGTKLVQACDEFYTRIPHDFGFSRPPVIRTKQELRLKMSLLEALTDIEVAMRIIKQSEQTEHPIDSQYKQLGCDLRPLSPTADQSIYKTISTYLSMTHASTHNQYTMSIQNIYEVSRRGEDDHFTDYGNRMLLWHGSRLTNWASILSQGLRIAPPEAPVTGYMFGKGIYFADVSSKSANYCFATRSSNTGLLLLCEVSLGTSHDLLAANYDADKLPKGKHSVKGLGRTIPDPSTYQTLPDGTVVPVGKLINSTLSQSTGYSLNYNEYVVYNTSQVRPRYLLEISFNFK